MSLSDEIDAISDKVMELERQNTHLQNLVDSLTEQMDAHQAIPEVEHLLDLLQTDIEAKEKCILNDERLVEVIATYRQLRPK